ncbi:MAG: hypothetical protein HQK81_02445 [Desulfovibrionaceae bacterium]|nr:hypothetical protein [Desulfovibrionaceae bacterium]MBF0512905.1 hypothetical protein [Desulfovibrionaceae bacterium]
MPGQSWSKRRWIFYLVLFVAALLYVGFARPHFIWGEARYSRLSLVFLLNLALVLSLALSIGYALSGRAAGIFIDSRNRISLSRFQLVLWTVLVAAAVWTTFAWNVAETSGHMPGDFTLPSQLYLALGISGFTGVVATPFLLGDKRAQTPDNAQFTQKIDALTDAGQVKGAVKNVGAVVTRDAAANAEWSDLFKGDEIGNFFSADIGKLQNFLFTIIVLASYAGALYYQFDTIKSLAEITAFPEFSATLTGFLAISHAAYLGGKAQTGSK